MLVAVLLLAGSGTRAVAQIRVNTDRNLGADIHVATPKLEKISFTADGQQFTGLYMRHASLLVEKKKPALPVLTGMVMISPNQKPVRSYK